MVTNACKGGTRSPAPLGVRCQHWLWCCGARAEQAPGTSDHLPLIFQLLGVQTGGGASLGAMCVAERPRETLKEGAGGAHCPELICCGHYRHRGASMSVHPRGISAGLELRPLAPPLACEAHGVPRDFLPVVSGWVLAADTVAARQLTAGATGPHSAWAQGQLAGLQACRGRAVSLGCRNTPHPAPKVAPGTEGQVPWGYPPGTQHPPGTCSQLVPTGISSVTPMRTCTPHLLSSAHSIWSLGLQ